MARRTHTKPDRLDEVLSEVNSRFRGSPLDILCDLVEPEVRDAQTALRGGFMGREDADRLAMKVAAFIEPLPRTFDARFKFDSAMIQAIAEEWREKGTFISNMIVPSVSEDWGHLSVAYARPGGASVPVDVILFPGTQSLEGVDLLGYPFLCHEMGHNILFTHDRVFGPRFIPALDGFSRSLQRRAMADRGAARQRAQDSLEEMRRLWRPCGDHKNWSHEIAVDVIATWTCGPAYLATLQDILEAEDLDPYQIGQSHPPYEVRANALLFASDRLGWASYTGGIRRQLDAWRDSRWGQGRTNTYLASANADLTRQCVEAALASCEALGLPRCTPGLVEELDRGSGEVEELEFGTELLLAAWLRRNRMSEEEYAEWERAVKELLCAGVTL